MISIIIPTKNEESVIEKTLKSLRAGGAISRELIVTDGASTDRTVEIAKAFADKVVEHTGPERQTIAAGRNAGAALAVGEFLVFMDADCSIMDPDRFFKTALEDFNDPKLVALTGWLRVLPEYETWADYIVFNIQNIQSLFVNKILHFGVSPGGEFQMIRASKFRQIGGYNGHLVAGEDVELFYRLSKIGRTRLDRNLKVFHTGRRAHTIGWPKLLSLWFLNSVWVITTGKAYTEEWKVIR
ncbi:MAG: glycosyltransferase [Candidatus Pacebacteria bacterium]|nr:glycosyltransferase [Candidatus Paceibacterota bacterium]